MHGGDFYNRFPTECRLVGTRRWAPGNTLEAVEAEFLELLAPIAAETGCSIELDLKLVRGAYSIDPEHELSRALRAGYGDVTGTELPLTGIKVVADARGVPGRGGDPDRLPRPGRQRRARRTSSSCPSPSSCARRRSTWRCSSTCGRREPALPSYDELRASFRWELPAVVNIGVEVSDRQPAAAPAILVTDGREITRTVTFGELTRGVEPARERARRARASARATASR